MRLKVAVPDVLLLPASWYDGAAFNLLIARSNSNVCSSFTADRFSYNLIEESFDFKSVRVFPFVHSSLL
jgi:hypothetical protein